MTITIDSLEFRKVLGQYATGVAVMTCLAPNGRLGGMTVNSFASLSLSPPLVLWSIDKTSEHFEQFAAATHYGVNILAEDQQHVSRNFSKALPNRFHDIQYSKGTYGSPLINGAIAQLECRISQRIEAGDHILLIGDVLTAEHHEKPPLLFFRGQYSELVES